MVSNRLASKWEELFWYEVFLVPCAKRDALSC